jgi:hypothetical protein
MKTKTSRQRKLQPKIRRVKKGHYILIKGTIHQEDIMIVNLYAPNFMWTKRDK